MVGSLTLVLVPQVIFAAPLTQAQAESLINVIQSSPGVPADAFTNLIIAFSNITITQADSLIGVIQAAPGVPANAFVNLLTSFTVDTAPATVTQTAQPTNTTQTPQTSSSATTTSTPQTLPLATTPVSQAHIEIVGPAAREYRAYDWNTFNGQNIPDSERPAGFVFPNESNYADLGAVLYNPDGSVNNTARMTITATDSTQNKTYGGLGEKQYPTYGGTGTVQWYWIDGSKKQRYFYPYRYEFKTAGKHVITFEADGLTASMELAVN